MHIQIGAESIEQTLISGQVPHDAQLNLRIVRRDYSITFRCHEGLANASPFFRTYGNVLQVGIRRRQPPGCRNRLVI